MLLLSIKQMETLKIWITESVSLYLNPPVLPTFLFISPNWNWKKFFTSKADWFEDELLIKAFAFANIYRFISNKYLL